MMGRDGKEHRCARCGDDEFRIHGFCSVRCEELADLEKEIASLRARCEGLEAKLAAANAAVAQLRNGLIRLRSSADESERLYNKLTPNQRTNDAMDEADLWRHVGMVAEDALNAAVQATLDAARKGEEK